MKKNKYHLKHIMLKVLTVFIIVVLISVGAGVSYAKDLMVGYKYYDLRDNQRITIGVSQQCDLIEITKADYLDKLTEKGYNIVSSTLDTTILNDTTIIHRSAIDDGIIQKYIIENLNISILVTKLQLKGDNNIYYFNSETECNDFVNKLNEYIVQETTIESSIEDYGIITSAEVLEQKIQEIKDKKAEIDKQKRISSRGNINRSSKKVAAPMASYVYISSYYGRRASGNHTGVDFAAYMGTEIYAWKSGTVTTARWNGNYGNFIEIRHDDGTISRYAHLSRYAVSAGQRVSQGQTIGYVGSTGYSTGPHLHFEIKINGAFVNPLYYL